MAETTSISWTTHTANPWWGCEEVHLGCNNCYARTLARAKGKAQAWEGARFAAVGVWKELPKWQARAQASGTIARVFCGSMMDIFEKSQPVLDWHGEPMPGVETGHLRDRYLREIVPATPNLQHLLLTKRPSNILKMVPREWLESGRWPANVMTGTSPVDQPTADTLIPQLLRAPGRHFLSAEPLLGAVTIPADLLSELSWVIVGGESGPKARPLELQWVRDLVQQCRAAGVACHVKQLGRVVHDDGMSSPGEHWPSGIQRTALPRRVESDPSFAIRLAHQKGGAEEEWPEDLRIKQFPNVTEV